MCRFSSTPPITTHYADSLRNETHRNDDAHKSWVGDVLLESLTSQLKKSGSIISEHIIVQRDSSESLLQLPIHQVQVNSCQLPVPTSTSAESDTREYCRKVRSFGKAISQEMREEILDNILAKQKLITTRLHQVNHLSLISFRKRGSDYKTELELAKQRQQKVQKEHDQLVDMLLSNAEDRNDILRIVEARRRAALKTRSQTRQEGKARRRPLQAKAEAEATKKSRDGDAMLKAKTEIEPIPRRLTKRQRRAARQRALGQDRLATRPEVNSELLYG